VPASSDGLRRLPLSPACLIPSIWAGEQCRILGASRSDGPPPPPALPPGICTIGQQAVHAFKSLVAAGTPDHRQHGPTGQDAGEVGGGSGPAIMTSIPRSWTFTAYSRVFSGSAVCRHHPHLEGIPISCSMSMPAASAAHRTCCPLLPRPRASCSSDSSFSTSLDQKLSKSKMTWAAQLLLRRDICVFTAQQPAGRRSTAGRCSPPRRIPVRETRQTPGPAPGGLQFRHDLLVYHSSYSWRSVRLPFR